MDELIAYFSRKHENYVNGEIHNLKIGNTEIVSGIIQKLTGANVFKIEPIQEYSPNYNECIAQAQADQRRNARPELKKYPKNLDSYNTIYLGFPNYWSTMPMAVFTFLERFDFTGKTIRPFCTHEGSGMGSSCHDIQRLCPGAKITEGLAIQGGNASQSEEQVKQWLEEEKK